MYSIDMKHIITCLVGFVILTRTSTANHETKTTLNIGRGDVPVTSPHAARVRVNYELA